MFREDDWKWLAVAGIAILLIWADVTNVTHGLRTLWPSKQTVSISPKPKIEKSEFQLDSTLKEEKVRTPKVRTYAPKRIKRKYRKQRIRSQKPKKRTYRKRRVRKTRFCRRFVWNIDNRPVLRRYRCK